MMKFSLNTYWQQRQPRERLLLLCLCAVLFTTMLWFGLHAAQAYQQRSEDNLHRMRNKLAIMQQQAPIVATLLEKQQRQRAPDWQQTALTLADKMHLPLVVAEHQKQHLTFKPTTLEFTALIRWLTSLETEWYIRASRLELRADPDGVKVIELELSRHE